MSVIESVRELGKEIQKDERFIRFAKARLESDNNTELQAMIGEFNVTRMELDRISAAEEQNEEKHKELNEQLREIYGKIMSNPSMVEFNTAKVALDQMMNEINVILGKTLDGEDPETCSAESGCSGSCASCGGCH